jgi:hypothetical protein
LKSILFGENIFKINNFRQKHFQNKTKLELKINNFRQKHPQNNEILRLKPTNFRRKHPQINKTRSKNLNNPPVLDLSLVLSEQFVGKLFIGSNSVEVGIE